MHESIPFCDGSGREACVACSEEADKCIPFPCDKFNPGTTKKSFVT